MSTFQSNNFSGSTFSGRTYYSGGTNLETIITNLAGNGGQTYVQPGTNITTGGTASAPIISVVASPVFTNMTASTLSAITVSLDTVNSQNGSIDTLNSVNFISSTIDAGIVNANTSMSSVLFTGGTVSGGTFYSGATPLSTIISNIAGASSGSVLALSAGTNITTGGTQQNPTVNVNANPTFTNVIAVGSMLSSIIEAGSLMRTPLLTATTVSGGTYYSGDTALETIISSLAVAGSTTLVQPGNFITTGGTSSQPTINLAQNISGATVSAGTIYSGTTNLPELPVFQKTNWNYQTYGPITAGSTLRIPLSGSAINIPTSGLKIGTLIRFKMSMTKTAAGTAGNAIGWHLGTGTGNAMSANTMLSCFSGVTQTAVVDNGIVYCDVLIKGPLGASCVAETTWNLLKNGSTAGFSTRHTVVSGITTSTFNSSTANLVSSFSFSGGASSVVTIPFVFVEAYNL